MSYQPLPTDTEVPDESDLAVKVKSLPSKVSRIGFTSAISNGVDPAWGEIIGGIGSGQDVDQTGGKLVLQSGTTARSETIIRSLDNFRGGIRLRVRSTLSQRIANNNFFAELVDVIGDGLAYTITNATTIVVTFPTGHGFTSENVGQSMYLGAFAGTGTFLSGRYPIASVSGDDVTFTVASFAAGTGTCSAFGWNYYHLLYTSTTATQAAFDTQRRGYASGDTTATISTTASPGHLAVITGNDMVATFADQLVATGATIKQTIRATRDENVPDDIPLRLQIRMANGSTNPASNTSWIVGYVSVTNFAPQAMSIQDVRPMGVGSGLPIDVIRAVAQTISGNVAVTMAANATTTPAKAEDAAHASADTGIPALGVRYETQGTAPVSAAGDYGFMQIDDLGKQVNMPYAPPVNQVQATTAAITNTSDTALLTAGGAGVRNYITGLTIVNSSAVPTVVEVKDNATVIWRGYIGANSCLVVPFLTPLKSTANTAINVACVTTATNTYVTATGFRAL